jgi:hypothetical protein
MAAIQNIQSIPFGALIGGPMTAAVQAQALAAMTTVDFIENVGFDPPPANAVVRPVKNVVFSYKKANSIGVEKTFDLTVPVLAIVPIPYLRIEELNIDFTAKLTDLVEHSEDTTSSVNLSAEASARWGWGRASFRGSYSRTHNQANKSVENNEYTMNVRLRATQSEVPGGLAKVLDMLEAAISETEQ